VERVDGTQARLKQQHYILLPVYLPCGKGGWDSGEIETQGKAGIGCIATAATVPAAGLSLK